MNSDSATYRTCRSDYSSIWWSAAYIYKTFILLYSAYLSWAIRAVTIPSMNDSVAIILSCLVTTFTGSATAAICVAFSDRPNVTSTVTMVSIWLCTTFTLCVVYIPKVKHKYFFFYFKIQWRIQGGAPGARPLWTKIFLISCSLSENLENLYAGTPSWRVGAPSYGESWIGP